MKNLAALAMVGALGFAAPAAADEVRDAIEQVNDQFVEAYKAGDAAAIASLYTETAKLLPPDATEVAGRAAIEEMWQGWIDGGLADLTLEAVEVESSGDLAYEIGAFTILAPGEGDAMVTAAGNYVVIWKRGDDGMWRLHIDTWNDAPAE